MMNAITKVYNHVTTHWVTSAIAITYAILTYMLYQKNITIEQWGIALGSLMTFKNFISKDPSKTESTPSAKTSETK